LKNSVLSFAAFHARESGEKWAGRTIALPAGIIFSIAPDGTQMQGE